MTVDVDDGTFFVIDEVVSDAVVGAVEFVVIIVFVHLISVEIIKIGFLCLSATSIESKCSINALKLRNMETKIFKHLIIFILY